MNNDDIFNNLRTKLDVLGYRQPLPLAACCLVAALFEDLVKTTESLRDAKLQISNFQEEKSCWELGVEPYKCDNSRLLAECNELHLKIVKQKDEFEEKLCEYVKKLRNLEADKRCLEDHCAELEAQIRHLTLRNFDDKLLKTKKNGANMSKKPFITTVKAGVLLPNPGQDPHHPRKCSKCNSIGWTKQSGGAPNAEIDKLQDDVREKSDQVTLYKKKVEERDREISRLNNLLTGGRPAPALAKDCCYKNVGTLSEDVGKLQREKAENLRTIRELEESMHEAKQRALDLSEKNKKLEKELTEFKDAALSVEQQANEEIAKKEGEIEKLCDEIRKLRRQQNENPQRKQSEGMQNSVDDKRLLNERINKLILREKELEAEIDKVCKKYTKLKTKMASLEKEKEAQSTREDKQTLTTELDEERIRLKSERDLFQKEYLRLVEKSGNASEIYCLRSQLKEKEDELIHLRSELCALRTQTCRTNHDRCTITPSTSVQAAILRAERERDVVCAELDRVKVERDLLREKLRCTSDTQITETDRYAKEIQELYTKISNLEKENHNLLSAQIPGQTHITLMKEEIEELKKRLHEFQSENSKLNTHYNQLKILHEQTERALVDHQNKLAISEANLRNAESRLNALNSNRDSSRSEVCALRNEMSVLKKMNMTLEQEKDKLVSELDNKTEKLFRMEDDVKTLKRCKEHLECTVSELKEKLGKATNEKRERESELHETSTESKTLRQTVGTLKEVRDQVLAENSRISNDLADCKAELSLTRKKLKESEKEVDRLKQQLQQYVQKVQKAEDLLLQKEREREEMLDHYRSLSHEAIALEGNNQGLELEAAEQKRQLTDAEEEISRLKRELSIKECTIQKLEKQVTHLSSQICCLEKQLEEAYDDQKLLKTDLDAIKELCEKLDLQSEKQNAELQERGEIISKLEKENIELRTNHPSSSRADKAATDILQDLLAKSRQELECERRNICKLAQEKLDLRKKNEDMQKRIEQERKKATERDALAKEYHVQLQELQRNLTDDRFQRARSREQSPRSLRSRGYAGYSQTSSTPRNSSMCQNQRTSHSEKSRRKSISPDYCSKERRSQYCRETTSSNSPQCPSSKKRAKQEENQKFMRDTLSKIHPNKRSKLVNDINTFLNDGKIRLSYNEELFFDEDTDDIIVRRHRKVKTYTVNGEEILENEYCRRIVNLEAPRQDR